MTIGIAVDATQGELGIDAGRRLEPPRTVLRIEHIGERPTGLDRFP